MELQGHGDPAFVPLLQLLQGQQGTRRASRSQGGSTGLELREWGGGTQRAKVEQYWEVTLKLLLHRKHSSFLQRE